MTDQGENQMSTPAQLPSTPEAYGERQQTQVVPTSEGVMDNLSRAAETDIADARARLRAGREAALSQLDMQYQMEKARIEAEYTERDGRLAQAEESIANFKANTIKAMDSFLVVCKGASVAAVELVPLAGLPRMEPEPPPPEAAPKFLGQRDERTPSRRPALLRAVALFGVAVLIAVGIGVGVALAQEVRPNLSSDRIPLCIAGGMTPEGLVRTIPLDKDGYVITRLAPVSLITPK